ncbi:MAG TPA: alpha/beta hydrolase, partial [Bacillota bacterium]|nr:alpha/beta hydrolase [Bacillota bacterium]
MKTYTYKKQDDLEIEGTLYKTTETHAPLLIYIHGGGLVWGTKDDIDKNQVDIYTNAGFNVFSIDYRLAPESKLPEIITDVQDALEWLVYKGKEYADF